MFIDTEPDIWNMSPGALEKAFGIYSETGQIVIAYLYGMLGKIEEIMMIADAHNALIVEDVAESFFGGEYKLEERR